MLFHTAECTDQPANSMGTVNGGKNLGELGRHRQSLLMPGLREIAGSLAVETIMERFKRFAHGALSQSELEIIKRVFDLATAQSWFDDTQYSRDGFAAALVGLFRCGMVNPAQLERIAMFWALSDFSQNMSGTQRAKLRSLYGRCEVEG